MPVTFTYRYGDLIAGARLSRARFGIPLAFGLGGGTRLFSGLAADQTLGHASYQGLWMGAIFVVGYWFLPHIGGFLSWRTPGVRDAFSVSWGPDGVRIDGARSSALWTREFVTKWYRSSALFVLRRGPAAIMPIPTRAFDSDQRRDFNEALARLYGEPARSRGIDG